ncbi:arginase family enzyme [Algoriphagus aquaeductus]|uniref:Arginase family enzyme n=1 Tax=Algoriphagus aquaeductus TaxID=475299 RepID=A0A326RT77_9BACT|nr:formimidoylglutamase [Algoriphagus aquaeductus]PZV78537.1 arginase family enzyme [Algoriphagus aquaeductus]
MNLQTFFDPVAKFLSEKAYPENSFFSQITIHQETFPDLNDVQIALVGLKECRGSRHAESMERGSSEIREKLYELKKGMVTNKVADLGDLISGDSLNDTYQKIRQVGEYLMKHQVLPVFFGGSHDLDYGQYLSYQKMKKLVTMVTVDAKIDMEESGPESDRHTQEIVLHQPNFLFSYTHLAYQSFLVDPTLVNVMEKLYFDHVRLGQIRDNFKETEPLIRDADLMSIDLSAIQSSVAPGAVDAQPFGLTGEEACQICWFAGTNEKLSSFGIYGYDPYFDDAHNKTAKVAAVMIWYFIEGFYSRKDSLSFKSADYIKYTVSLDTKPNTLVFYKSKRSGKWWMEIPHNETDRFDRVSTVSCSYADYQLAQKGEIPERWINAQIKLY